MGQEPVLKNELIARMSELSGLDRKTTGLALDAMIEALREAIETARPVRINRIGRFDVIRRDRRKASNPKTGDAVVVEPRYYVTFSAAPNLAPK